MTTFNLELAKQGHPVKTRSGHPVRIICFNRRCYNNTLPIVALVDNPNDSYESVEIYNEKGEYYPDRKTHKDLMMA